MTLSPKDVIVGSLEEAAGAATGTAVIIDVFRAFTTASMALRNGAERIVMVGDLDQALALRGTDAGTICMGERGGERPKGFDYGNSPAEIANIRFDGESLIQTTSNGTRGILAARNARRIYAGAFSNAAATARSILADPVLPVSLVAMGDPGGRRTDEDELCALYLRALLMGRIPDKGAVSASIQTMADLTDTRRLSSADVSTALQIDSADFAILVESRGDHAIGIAHCP